MPSPESLVIVDRAGTGLKRMQRIAIVGNSGAGKSTLAKALHGITGIPLVHLDREFWKPGWVASDKEEFRQWALALYEGESWIVEGNYTSNLDERLARADTVFHLDFSTLVSLRRVLWRIARGYGREREDCGVDCPEQFDLVFLKYVIQYRRDYRPKVMEIMQRHPHLTIHRFHNSHDVNRFLEEMSGTRNHS